MDPDSTSPYSAFKSPPDFDECEIHARAILVSDPTVQPEHKCLCCKRPVFQQRLPICTSLQSLNFLGAEIPTLFYYFRLLFVITIIAMLLSAGSYYCCISFGNVDECTTTRLKFSVLNYFVDIPLGFRGNPPPDWAALSIQAVYTLCFVGLQIYIKTKIMNKTAWARTVANQSIQLSNVPVDVSDEQLSEFLRNRGIDSLVLIERVKKMVFFKQILEAKRDIKKKLYKAIRKDSSKRQELELQKQQIDRVLVDYKNRERQNPVNFRTKTVLVTLENQDLRNDFLQQFQRGFWSSLWFRWFYCCSKTRLRNSHIIVQDAPPPRDIIWENIEAPYVRTKILRFASLFLTLLLVLSCSVAVLFLSRINEGTLLEGLVVSLFIQVTNYFIVELIQFSADFEAYPTYTGIKQALFSKMSLFLFLNTTIIPFVLFAFRVTREAEQVQTALDKMLFSLFFISLGNLIKPLILFVSFGRISKAYARWKERRRGPECQLSQFEANRLWEPQNFPIQVIYSLCLASFLSTFFYLSILPGFLIPQFLVIGLTWITARYLLLKRCKTPHHYTSQLSNTVCKLSQFCVVLFYIGKVLTTALIRFKPGLSFWNLVYQQFNTTYDYIELLSLITYLLLVVVFDIDDKIARWWTNRQLRKFREEATDEMKIGLLTAQPGFNYRNANSFYVLMEQQLYMSFMGDEERQRLKGYSELAQQYKEK